MVDWARQLELCLEGWIGFLYVQKARMAFQTRETVCISLISTVLPYCSLDSRFFNLISTVLFNPFSNDWFYICLFVFSEDRRENVLGKMREA